MSAKSIYMSGDGSSCNLVGCFKDQVLVQLVVSEVPWGWTLLSAANPYKGIPYIQTDRKQSFICEKRVTFGAEHPLHFSEFELELLFVQFAIKMYAQIASVFDHLDKLIIDSSWVISMGKECKIYLVLSFCRLSGVHPSFPSDGPVDYFGDRCLQSASCYSVVSVRQEIICKGGKCSLILYRHNSLKKVQCRTKHTAMWYFWGNCFGHGVGISIVDIEFSSR